MKKLQPQLAWLSDPSVYAVNRLPAYSDHRYYVDEAEAASGVMSMRRSLNGRWKFHYAVSPDSRPVHFYKPEFDCSAWGEIQVPGHIQTQGYGQMQYVNTMYPWDGHEHLRPPEVSSSSNPVGSYVRTFRVPEEWRGQSIYISFQGVETAFYVWLNGQFVGYSEDSFTPADFELTPYVKEGENRLAVEVYQRSTGAWLEDQDFWRFSGIFRDVYVYTVPKVHVRDMQVNATLDDSYQTGLLSVEMRLEQPVSTAHVKAQLQDASGTTTAELEGAFAEDGTLQLTASVAHVQAWSAERPYLYTLLISVYDEQGDLSEVINQRVGFRRFELAGKVMKLNGKRIVFKGVNRHEFNCRTGRAVTREDMLWDIRTMKQNNINAVRTSHYPNQSLWYELCDEYGIYVIDEMNLETHGSWQKLGKVEPSWNIPGDLAEWREIVLDRAVSMLERDKNHPSILIWSCGNESYAGEVLRDVANYFRERDPSRLVHYEGVFHNRKFDDISDMESRMYAKPAEIEEYLREEPQKPYISCEYMHAMANSLGGMHKYTELEDKYELYQGGFIWDFIDQSVLKKDRYGQEFMAYGGDYDDRPTDYNFCGNGIVYANRVVSPKMQEVKFLYQNVKLHPDRGGVRIKNGNLFIGLDDYELVATLYRDGEEVYRTVVYPLPQVAPQSEAYVKLELPDVSGVHGEYALHTSLLLRKQELWADPGHETAFGQYVFVVEGKDAASADAVEEKLRVVHGDVNVGVHGEGFSVLFSKAVGSLVSLRYGDREMIAAPPRPLFWRALTDNDKGVAQGFHAGAWLAASLAPMGQLVDVEESPQQVKVTFRYALNIHPDASVTVQYTVRGGGKVQVHARYDGVPGLPEMPIFALTFKMKADYDELDWYAMGPEENYADRCHGARLMRFRNRVADNVAKYLVPQESGNRTGVRRVDITDAARRGIRISAPYQQPVECNVSPYTAFELENANHPFELPNVHYTVVTVAGRVSGVGGDDSWGAPVHAEYRIPSDGVLQFEFAISPL